MPPTPESLPTLETTLERDLERSIKVLNNLGLVEIFTDTQEAGIQGYDGKRYELPEPGELLARINEKREIFEEKLHTFENPRFLLVPLAISIPKLLETYASELMKRKDSLVFSDGTKEIDEPRRPLPNWNEYDSGHPESNGTPLYSWEKYQTADTNMKYLDEHTSAYKDEADKENGKSKAEKVLELNGYSIFLMEDVSDVPKTGTGTQERKTPPAGTTPKDILALLQQANKDNTPLSNERGLYLEEYITYALTKLIESNTVIEGKGKYTWLTSNFLSGYVPCAGWSRVSRQTSVYGSGPAEDGSSHIAVRLGVGA